MSSSVHKLIQKFSKISDKSNNSNKSNQSSTEKFINESDRYESNINQLSINDLHPLIETKLKSIKDLSLSYNQQRTNAEMKGFKELSLKQQIDIIKRLTQEPSEHIRNLLVEFKLYFEARKSGNINNAKIVDLNLKLDRLVQEVELMLVSLQEINYLQKGFEVMKEKIKRLINAIFFIEKAAECIRYESKRDNKELLSEINSLLETSVSIEVSLSSDEPTTSIEDSTDNNHSPSKTSAVEKDQENKRNSINSKEPNSGSPNAQPDYENQESYTVFEIYEDKIISKTKFLNSNDKEEKSIILQYQINL